MVRRARVARKWRIKHLGCKVEDAIFLAPSDASQGSMPREGSQAGYATVVASPNILEGEAPANILDTVSCRIKRVVRSSLAAEVASANLALEHGEFARCCLAEIWDPCFRLQAWQVSAAKWRLILVLDAKTGYDVLQHDTVAQDRRVEIDVAALRETLRQDGYAAAARWLPGPQHLADGLTKKYGNGVLEAVMENCRWSLVETEDVRDAREKQRKTRKAIKTGGGRSCSSGVGVEPFPS